ncbi:MAG: hypothetical protein WC734_03960 [Patescibacteria group bacterium]|jgi:hypothetical protein
MPKLDVHGHSVEGEMEPLRYLIRLDNEEADVLFRHARDHGPAEFEIKYVNYALGHHNGKYTVEKR